jgi:hypothetical protein
VGINPRHTTQNFSNVFQGGYFRGGWVKRSIVGPRRGNDRDPHIPTRPRVKACRISSLRRHDAVVLAFIDPYLSLHPPYQSGPRRTNVELDDYGRCRKCLLLPQECRCAKRGSPASPRPGARPQQSQSSLPPTTRQARRRTTGSQEAGEARIRAYLFRYYRGGLWIAFNALQRACNVTSRVIEVLIDTNVLELRLEPREDRKGRPKRWLRMR